MGPLDFLTHSINLSSPAQVAAYDELPLWSSMFGLLLLDEVPLAGVATALDVGCGTGFPLIELAGRLGPGSLAYGIDTWAGAVARAQDKVVARGMLNVSVCAGDAAAIPFADGSFDLIVSNLGLNNFDDPDAAVRDCRRVARAGGRIALATNVQGHMHEFYETFRRVLEELGDDESLRRLQRHVEHRATISHVQELLARHGFAVERVVKREGVMRFGSGTALLNHYFIKLGFLDAWKSVIVDTEKRKVVFTKLLQQLDDLGRVRGEVRLSVPMAYVEAEAVS